MRYLHLCDNTTLDVDDRMSKVRPLLSILNEKLLTYFEPYQGAKGRVADCPGRSVILDLVSELQEEEGCYFHFTF